jgi:hypothetical protein
MSSAPGTARDDGLAGAIVRRSPRFRMASALSSLDTLCAIVMAKPRSTGRGLEYP